MQPSRNFDDLKFSSIHRRILLWGSGGPFLDGYVLVMIGVALEQLTPALKLDADWIGLLGAGTLAGLFVGTSLFGYISDKVGRRKMFLIDIIAIGVISVATMFVSSPVELLVMRVLIGIVIGADYPIATSMITEFSSTRQRAFSMSNKQGRSERMDPGQHIPTAGLWKAPVPDHVRQHGIWKFRKADQ